MITHWITTIGGVSWILSIFWTGFYTFVTTDGPDDVDRENARLILAALFLGWGFLPFFIFFGLFWTIQRAELPVPFSSKQLESGLTDQDAGSLSLPKDKDE